MVPRDAGMSDRVKAPVRPEIRPRLESTEPDGPIRTYASAGRTVGGQQPVTRIAPSEYKVSYGLLIKVGHTGLRVKNARTQRDKR